MKTLIIFFLLINSLSALARRGIESGGGGGVILLDSRPVLMDYFTIIKNPDELPHPNYLEASRIPLDTNQAFSLTRENIKNIINSNNAFAGALSIFKDWESLNFPLMPSLIKLAIADPLLWRYVDHNLDAPEFYLAPSLPKDVKTSVAAFYQNLGEKNFEVLINTSIWNNMDLEGQVGLIIHETLRQVQLGFEHGFDDEALQRATAIYLMCQPTNRLNYYTFFVLSNSPKNADQIYGSFKSFIESECRRK